MANITIRRRYLALALVIGAVLASGIAWLFIDIYSKKNESRQYPLMLNKVTDDNVSPDEWGKNFAAQFDSFKMMSESQQYTSYGGSLPYSKLIRYPQLVRLWAGYPFSADFNEERGHFYSQIDQIETKRNDKAWLNAHGFPKFTGQPGACMNCHSGWAPKLIREMGWEGFNKTPYTEIADNLKNKYGEGFHAAALGGTCADCHHPEDMSLRVTRPAYINAMKSRGYELDQKSGLKATRQEMRSHVCQQCHVEYYFKKGSYELTFPWNEWPKDQPLKIEMIESYYNELRKDKDAFQYDWIHKESGAKMLKVQHPEAELYSSGVHARSGVACADCHMPYKREGAVKVTNHHIRSPLFNVNASCQSCHSISEEDLKARVDFIQKNIDNNLRTTEMAILALVDDIKKAQKTIESSQSYQILSTNEEKESYISSLLDEAREFHRRASLRWDFIASENSTGFHSPQESNRVLSQAIEMARRGQITLINSLSKAKLQIESLTIKGSIPTPAARISEHKSPVGDPPPIGLIELDKLQSNGLN